MNRHVQPGTLIQKYGLIFILLLLVRPAIADSEELAEELSIGVTVYITWNIDTKADIKKGFLRYSIGGNLQLDKENTKGVNIQGRTVYPIILYTPSSVTVNYSYLEQVFDKDPDGCPPLHTMYRKEEGSFNLGAGRASEARADLSIRRMGSIMPEGHDFPNMPGKPAGPGMCDYYEFYAAGPAQTIEGKEIGSDCEYVYADKEVVICRLGIRFELPKTGSMFDSRTWSSSFDKNGLVFKISLSDLPAPLSDQSYYPDMDPDGDITYNVVWAFGGNIPEYETAVKKIDKEKDCQKLQDRIDFINIVRSVYSNARLRQYANSNFSDPHEAMARYQNAVEELSIDISNDPALRDPAAIDNYLNNLSQAQMIEAFQVDQGDGSAATTFMYTEYETDPKTKKITTIMIKSTWEGEPVDLITYSGNGGNEVITDACYRAQTLWINENWEYSQEVGQALFWSCIAHEKTHVRQYAEKGPTKSVNDLAERELEAFQTEIDRLKGYRKDMGCD